MKKQIKFLAVCFSFLWITILVCDAKNTQNHKNLLPFKSQNGKWGYIDDQGKTVIAPRFDLASNFSEGRAEVCFAHPNPNKFNPDNIPTYQCDFIDETGNIAFSLHFSLIEREEDGQIAGNNFSDGLVVSDDHNLKYIDTQGRTVIPNRWFKFTGPFSENLAVMATSQRRWLKEENQWDDTYNTKYGYIDKTGRIVIAPHFDRANNFSDGLARVEVHHTKGDVEKNLKALKKDWGNTNADGSIRINLEAGMDFIKNSMEIETDYINSHGDVVIKLNPQFTWAQDFSEGLAAVKVGDKWGYINKHGNLIIKPQFDDALPALILELPFSKITPFTSAFSEGLAGVGVSEDSNIVKKGFIDKSGAFVIPPTFLDVRPFYHGVAAVYWGGQHWSLLNKTGKILADVKADNINNFENGAAKAVLDGTVGYISTSGKWILKPSKAWPANFDFRGTKDNQPCKGENQ